MSVQFILGRSGTGKTSLCVNRIVKKLLQKSNQKLLFLVPEQATYQAERAILAHSGNGHPGQERITGYHRLEVVSFNRLHFLLLGKDTARPELSKIGRQMIIHRLLRENSDKLNLFSNSAHRTGLAQEMAQTIQELHQYGKTQDQMELFLEELQKQSRQADAEQPEEALEYRKTYYAFQDIALIFREYLKAIEGRFADPDVELNHLRRAISAENPAASAGNFIKAATLWVDGFSHFTGGQLEILAELLKNVQRAEIALCLDPEKIDVHNPAVDVSTKLSLFKPTEKLYAQLFGMVKKCKLQLQQPEILKKKVRFADSPPLEHIEQNLFRPDNSKSLSKQTLHGASKTDAPAPDEASRKERPSSLKRVRILSAPDVRSEVESVATQITHLVRKSDLRYRDIAVITPDVEQYEHYVRAVFDDYSIPFFIDTRKSLQKHPVVELLCSALSLVGDDFSGSDVFSYLKSDLVPLDRYEVDLLENYCIAFGPGPEDWINNVNWNFAPPEDFDEAQINEIKNRAMQPILFLRKKIRNTNGLRLVEPEVFTRTVFDFLKKLQIQEKLAQWIEQQAQNQNTGTHYGNEHRQFYEKMVSLFDELVEVFRGRQLSCEDYLCILTTGFSQLTLALIPPNLDQVIVGSIERSRHPDLKAAFLVGATQRQFPVPLTAGGIIEDDDRELAEMMDFSLAPRTEQKLMERQYLAYIAFTRPSQYLFVSYPLAGKRDSPEVRSQYLERLEELFEDLHEENTQALRKKMDEISSRQELAESLTAELGTDADRRTGKEKRQELYNLLDALHRDVQMAQIADTVNYAINYRNAAHLDKHVVKSLFGRTLKSSATRLGTFAACPYKYFAKYILQLQKRKEFELQPLDLGLFYHQVLDLLLKELKKQNLNFKEITENKLLKILREQIRRLVESEPFIANFSRRSPHNAFMIRSAAETLELSALAIKQMVSAGKFTPACSELGFGSVKDTKEYLGEYRITLPDGRTVSLSGKIDRLDTQTINGQKVGIVFDYKRTDTSFDWSYFYHGLNVQLPIYMLAAVKGSNEPYRIDKAAGGFFIPIEARPGRSELGEMEKQKEKFQYKAKGIINGPYALQLDNAAYRDSDFYNFYVKKDGSPYGRYGNTGALEPETFQKLLEFTQEKIRKILRDVLSGKIEVNPCRIGNDSPCQRCDYRSLCRFDWQINNYNHLRKMTKTDVLERIT